MLRFRLAAPCHTLPCPDRCTQQFSWWHSEHSAKHAAGHLPRLDSIFVSKQFAIEITSFPPLILVMPQHHAERCPCIEEFIKQRSVHSSKYASQRKYVAYSSPGSLQIHPCSSSPSLSPISTPHICPEASRQALRQSDSSNRHLECTAPPSKKHQTILPSTIRP